MAKIGEKLWKNEGDKALYFGFVRGWFRFLQASFF